MTPEKSPQRQGLPTGSGGTKQMPDEVEHFELACANRRGKGDGRSATGVVFSTGGSAGGGRPIAATARPAQPATAIMPKRASRMGVTTRVR